MNWSIFLLMLPHLKPKCLDILFPGLYRALDVARVVSLLIVCVLFVLTYRKERRCPSAPIWVLGALEGWICLVALLKDGDYVETCSLAVSAMGIALLVDLYSDRMKELLTALMLNYEWLVYANLFTMLLWPGVGIAQDPEYGNMPIFFFGPDNWFMYLCIPAACVAMLYLRVWVMNKHKVLHILRSLCLLVGTYACVWLQKPMTALLAMVAIAAVAVAAMIPGVRRCVNFPLVFLCGIAANLAISIFHVQSSPAIAQLMLDVLNKNHTLSSRTRIWDSFLEQIREHLWLGIGTPQSGYYLAGEVSDHLHNQYFDLLAQGGIPALLLFVAVLLLGGKVLTTYRKTPAARIMTACIAGLLVMCIPEVCRHGSIFLLFPLAYHIQKIEAASQCEV